MKILAVLALALLAGCGGLSTSIEACIVDPEYGKICASYDAGKITITADAVLPPAVRGRIEEYMKKLAGEK